MRRAAWLTLLAVVMGGACGSGSSGPEPVASRQSDGRSEQPASATEQAPAGSEEDAAPAGSRSAPPEPSSEPAADGQGASGGAGPVASARTLELDVALASDCVRPGTTQTITVRSEPGSAVVYGATYSDGVSGFSPDHYGGNASGHVNGHGEYRDTWVVGAEAPEGPVKVDVAAIAGDGATGQAQVEFAVSNVLGKCS